MSEPQTSKTTLAFAFLLFLFASAVFLYGLIDSSYTLITGFMNESNLIWLKKGGLYGIGVMAPIMFTWGFLILLIKGKATDKQEQLMGRVMIPSVVLMLTFPHFVHYGISKYLNHKGYIKCEPMSRQWMQNVTIAYTITTEECDRLSDDHRNRFQ